jgi:rifampicin phosphotransferase
MFDVYPNDSESSVEFPLYSRGNYGEAFPNPLTPMTGSLIEAATKRGQQHFAIRSGMMTTRDLVDPRNAVSGQFWGYQYGNGSIARRAGVRIPGVKVSDIDEQFAGVGVLPPYIPSLGDRDFRATIRLLRFANRAFSNDDAAAAVKIREEVDAWRASLPSPHSSSQTQLLDRVRSLSRWCEQLIVHMMTVSLHAATARVLIERIAGSNGPVAAANAMTSGLGDVVSAHPALVLWDLARQVTGDPLLAAHFDAGTAGLEQRLRDDRHADHFMEGFDSFLAEYGFHGIDELEAAAPKWGTDPAVPLAIIEGLRRAPIERDPRRSSERLAQDRLTAVASSRRSVGWPKRKLLDRALRATVLYTPAREATKSALVKTVYEACVGLLELARRADINGDDIFFVTEPELESFLSEPGRYGDDVARRRTLRQTLSELTPPFWFSGEIPDPTTWEKRETPGEITVPGTTLHGLGVSTGRITGTARVMTDPNDPSALEPGDILIAPETDPAWTPLFLIVAGVVVDVGAQTSHAATIARELGIPAVVGVADATRRIQNGTRITIDGSTGTVDIE